MCVELFGAYNAPNGCMQHATSTAQWMKSSKNDDEYFVRSQRCASTTPYMIHTSTGERIVLSDGWSDFPGRKNRSHQTWEAALLCKTVCGELALGFGNNFTSIGKRLTNLGTRFIRFSGKSCYYDYGLVY